jgi:hypothetical protein
VWSGFLWLEIGSTKHSNEISSSINGGKFNDGLSYHELIRLKDFLLFHKIVEPQDW